MEDFRKRMDQSQKRFDYFFRAIVAAQILMGVVMVACIYFAVDWAVNTDPTSVATSLGEFVKAFKDAAQ